MLQLVSHTAVCSVYSPAAITAAALRATKEDLAAAESFPVSSCHGLSIRTTYNDEIDQKRASCRRLIVCQAGRHSRSSEHGHSRHSVGRHERHHDRPWGPQEAQQHQAGSSEGLVCMETREAWGNFEGPNVRQLSAQPSGDAAFVSHHRPPRQHQNGSSGPAIVAPELLKEWAEAQAYTGYSSQNCIWAPPPSQVAHPPPTSQAAQNERFAVDPMMLASGTVREYMSARPLVLTPSMTLREAAELFLLHDLRGAPVVEPYAGDYKGLGRLVGVFMEEDLLYKEARHEQADATIADLPFLKDHLHGGPLLKGFKQQVMKILAEKVGDSVAEVEAEPLVVEDDMSVTDAAEVMLQNKAFLLPVVASRERGKPGKTVIGIITAKDILRHVMLFV